MRFDCSALSLSRTALLPLVLLAAAPAVRAQENLELGKMWLFEDPPLAYLEDEYGFRPDAGWLDLVRLASLRFGDGCSASFVSPKGLILTNHHCVRGNIAENQGDNDWVANGFVARRLEDEVPLRGLSVQQLVATADVTAAMNEGIDAKDDAATIEAKLEANRRKVLERANAEHGDLRHQVVSLFQGALHHLYSYRVYDDVRLVCAPHLQTAHFGGDPDNFTYPRFGIDFAFCRAYVDGKPADTAGAHFDWSDTGAAEGELVFVTGNPGSTERLLTKAQLEYLRDAQYPIIRELIDGRLAMFRDMASSDPRMEKQLRTQILSLENAQKAYGGMHEALLDDDFMAHKERAEAAFRARIAAVPELQERFGSLWDQIAEIAAEKTRLEAPRRFYTPGGSSHLARAVMVYRAAASGDEQQAQRARRMRVDASPMAAAQLADHLARAAKALPAGDPYLQMLLGDRDPEAAVEHFLASTEIADDDFVAGLLDGGMAAVEASDDPAVKVARFIVPRIEANQERAAELEARETVLGTEIGRAAFAVYGKTISPDATFTLRFSDGVVKGYPYNGTIAPHRTSFYGLYARNVEFDNRYPFNLPEVWLQRRDRIDMTKSVDFACTNDSTGGNSGSPVINAKRELVGLLFDGNIESLGNQFIFRDDVPRSVCVHVEAISEALAKIYDAERVLAELRDR